MSVIKSSLIFSFGTLLSRFSGLVRDQVVLAYFGVSVILDAFFLAFRIPNLFREMLAEGALGGAFTKVYSQLKEKDSKAAQALLVQCLQLGLLILLILIGLGLLIAPFFVDLMTMLANDSSDDVIKFHATGLSRLLFGYLGLAIIGAIVSGALFERGKFFLSALAPAVFNLFFILGAIYLAGWFEEVAPPWWSENVADPRASGLAFGVLLGGCFQVLLQAKAILSIPLIRKVVSPHFEILSDTKKVGRLMVPAALAGATSPLGVIVNTNFAVLAGEGAITWLMAAFRLFQLPVGLFGVAVGVVILPRLSKKIESHTLDPSIHEEIAKALEIVGWLLCPCFVLLMISNQDIIALLFEYGKFDFRDTRATSQALFYYSFGVMGYGFLKVLTSIYYATSRTKYAMWVTFLCVGLGVLSNYLLVGRMGHVALALTSSITLSLNALLLLLGLHKYNPVVIYKRLVFLSFRVTVIAIVCVFAVKLCHFGLNSLHYGFRGDGKIDAFLRVAIDGVVISAVCFMGVCFFHKLAPRTIIKEFKARSK